MADYISCADTAKLVRAALKEAFPEIKFSVKSHVYAGGASINVSWIDGPIVAQVDPIVKTFAGGSFDGMTDCMNYHRSQLNGKEVRFSFDFVFTRHDVSPARVDAMIKCLEQAGKDWWLTVCCDMGHPYATKAVEMARDDVRELAFSILNNCPPSQFEGRKSPLAQSISVAV